VDKFWHLKLNEEQTGEDKQDAVSEVMHFTCFDAIFWVILVFKL